MISHEFKGHLGELHKKQFIHFFQDVTEVKLFEEKVKLQELD